MVREEKAFGICISHTSALAQGGRTGDVKMGPNGELTSTWWLRSPGDSAYNAASVGAFGDVDTDGYYVYAYGDVVRPALIIELTP